MGYCLVAFAFLLLMVLMGVESGGRRKDRGSAKELKRLRE